jgi:hypothetical protein
MKVTQLAEPVGIGRPHLCGIEVGQRNATVVVVKLVPAPNATASNLLRLRN